MSSLATEYSMVRLFTCTLFFALLFMAFTTGCQRTVAEIPADTSMTELSADQLASYCDHFRGQRRQVSKDKSFSQAQCLFHAGEYFFFPEMTEDNALEKCEWDHAHCIDPYFIDEGGEDYFGPLEKEPCFPEKLLRECNASVAEVDRCQRSLHERELSIIRPLASMTCQDFATAEGRSELARIRDELLTFHRKQPTEECKVLHQRCPGLV